MTTNGRRHGWSACILWTIAVVLLGAPRVGQAQRPSGARLFPEETVVYVRVADMPELVRRFQQTSTGRIAADEQVLPFVQHLYGSLLDAFEAAQKQLGASLSELLSLAQGELAIAVVLPPEGRPCLGILLETKENRQLADQLLERGAELLVGAGASRKVVPVNETEITVYKTTGERAQELATFQRDGVVMITSSAWLAQSMLTSWDAYAADDEVNRVLAQNRKFVAIMNRSRGLKDEPPHATWFLDPFALIKRLVHGDVRGQAAVVTMEALGLGGLKAAGGGVVLLSKEFDTVTQSHLLIGQPREGLIKMIALEAGETRPEPWVPTTIASYTTAHWNFAETYGEVVRLFDLFRGESAWEETVRQRVSQRLQVDLEKDLLNALEGRVTHLTWIQQPPQLNSKCSLLGLRLVDAPAFEQTLARMVRAVPDRFSSAEYRGLRYYDIATPRRDDRGEDNGGDFRRVPEPCLAVVGDYLIVTDSRTLLKEVIRTKADSSRSLANELDFKLVLSKIRRQQEGETLSAITFSRPEQSFRLLYDLATEPEISDRLAASEQPVLLAIREALKQHPLPPFSVIARYLAPGGSLVTYDAVGIHRTGFSLARRRRVLETREGSE